MYLLSRAGIVYFAFFFGTLDCYCQPRGKLRVVNVEPRSCEQLRRGSGRPYSASRRRTSGSKL